MHRLESRFPRKAISKIGLAGLLAASVVAGSVVPSFALPGSPGSSPIGTSQDDVTKVANRGHVDFDPARHRGRQGHRYRMERGFGYGGAALGAGIVGLAAGAMLGDATAFPGEVAEEAVSYCASRFRSYDPSTGTYLGYDGYEHSCP